LNRGETRLDAGCQALACLRSTLSETHFILPTAINRHQTPTTCPVRSSFGFILFRYEAELNDLVRSFGF